MLSEGRSHELGSALLAIAGALFFGLGFGRVLQLVHTRAWRLPLPTRQTDQALYGAVLVGLYGLILLLLVQLNALKDAPSWTGKVLALGWAGLLVAFFVWAPWLLTHRQVSRRDLLPGAVLTASYDQGVPVRKRPTTKLPSGTLRKWDQVVNEHPLPNTDPNRAVLAGAGGRPATRD